MSRLFAIDDVLDSDTWYTPAWVFEGLGIEFDLDVAHPAERLDWIPAREVYTLADNGLLQPWWGTIWCNPPYSDPAPWCQRWARYPCNGCILLRSDLSTSGVFAAMRAATSLYVPAKRLQFVNGHGVKSGSVNFSSVLFGKGDVADRGLSRLAATHGGVARQLHKTARPTTQ